MTTPDITDVLCSDCAKLGMMTQPTAPHCALLQRGTMPQSANGPGKELFRCAECNTLWVRHIDKWGQAGTFYLHSRYFL